MVAWYGHSIRTAYSVTGFLTVGQPQASYLIYDTTSSGNICCVLPCSFDFERTFGVSVMEMSKAERLQYGESLMTHAMVLTGVHVEVGPCLRCGVIVS